MRKEKTADRSYSRERMNRELPSECPEDIRDVLVRLDHLLERQNSDLIDEKGFNWGSRTICSSTARFTAYHLDGNVAGFYFDENPGATLGREFNRGHDFCVTDDWVVDYWARFVHNTARDLPEHPTVLHREHDSDLIETFYGADDYWRVRAPEAFETVPEQR